MFVTTATKPPTHPTTFLDEAADIGKWGAWVNAVLLTSRTRPIHGGTVRVACIGAHIAEAASLAAPIVWHKYYTPELATVGGNDSHRGSGHIGGTDRVDTPL